MPGCTNLDTRDKFSPVSQVAERPMSSRQHVDETSRAAVIAAVAAGQSQVEVAKAFNLHRNTVWSICNNVKSVANRANPFSGEYKAALKTKSILAIHRGLDHKRDPYKAATIGVKVLEGIGEFVTGAQVKVDTTANVVFSWGPTTEAEHTTQVIETTAEET